MLDDRNGKRKRSKALVDYNLVYLATPFTDYSQGHEAAFEHAAALTGVLIATGIRIYAPIVHCYPAAKFGRLKENDLTIWLPHNKIMMDLSDALLVALMVGWEGSEGVQREIEYFKKVGKPIHYLDKSVLSSVA